MTGSPSPSRQRIALGGYACGPVDEPEARAAWEFAVAAAGSFDVWVFTRTRFQRPIEAELERRPDVAAHLHVVYLDLPPRVMAWKKRAVDLYWYYALWQWRLRGVVLTHHRREPFALLHHLTFANDWLPCGLAYVPGPPFIWGPVGGATDLPILRMRRWLGPRGVAIELVRAAATALPRRIFGDGAARRAHLVVAQNDDVARRFARHTRRVVVEPNAVLSSLPTAHHTAERDDRCHAVYAGRLIPLKGVRLALTALARPELRNWTLSIYGDGQQRAALERMAGRLGIDDRVSFLGHRPRHETLAAVGTADAFLFPSLHDQASWAVAEASSMGCPVVCLPLGGPPRLAGPNGHVADLEGDLPATIAAQLQAAAREGGVPHAMWSSARLPALLDDWYTDALSVTPGRART